MSRMTSVGLAAGLLMLTGCLGDATYVKSRPNSSTYEWLNYTKYHAGKETRVTIHGNPFGIDREEFERAVLRYMYGAHPGVPTDFTTTPGPDADKYFHVVVAFNSDAKGYELCTGRDYIETRPAGDDGWLTLNAAWCHQTRADSQVTAWTGRPEGVDDPQFARLVSQATRNLLLGRQNVREDDDDDDNMND